MHPLGAGCHRAGGVGAGATHPTSHSFQSRCFDEVALQLATWPGVFHYAYALLYHLCHPLLLSFTSGTVDPSLLAHPNGTSHPTPHQFHTSTSRSTHHPRTSISLLLGHLPSMKDLRVGTCAFTQRTACGRTRWEIHYQHTYACGTYGGRRAMHYQHTYTVGLSQIPSTSKVAT
ncbi:hypothetical protein B0H11DRAFT_2034004 [Mycena galericulata]|nr:hypothetical protein B0H11DRAFT_2034004 [Mycena galericulata]